MGEYDLRNKKKAVSLKYVVYALLASSSAVLSFAAEDGIRLSYGSVFVILATCCWGIENNCTRRISDRRCYESCKYS